MPAIDSEQLAAIIASAVDDAMASRDARIAALEALTKDVMSYKRVWENGGVYKKGDAVTHDGSLWCCVADATRVRPGLASIESRAWVLAVKHGRHGRDAKDCK
jgi:hypothetical protein